MHKECNIRLEKKHKKRNKYDRLKYCLDYAHENRTYVCKGKTMIVYLHRENDCISLDSDIPNCHGKYFTTSVRKATRGFRDEFSLQRKPFILVEEKERNTVKVDPVIQQVRNAIRGKFYLSHTELNSILDDIEKSLAKRQER